MTIVEVLYVILGACVVVITVTIVWLANETIKLVKSLRKSSDDVAFMTQEVKEKVLVVTEALDRAGTAATSIIGFIEDAIEGIKEKRDKLSDSIGLIAGVGDFFKKKSKKDEPEVAKEEKKEEISSEAIAEEVEDVDKEKEKPEKKEEKDTKKVTVDDLEHAKSTKKEVEEKAS